MITVQHNGQTREIRDYFGRELNIGDKVVYSPASRTSSLEEGTIVEYIHEYRRYDPLQRATINHQEPAIGLKMINGHKKRFTYYRGDRTVIKIENAK